MAKPSFRVLSTRHAVGALLASCGVLLSVPPGAALAQPADDAKVTLDALAPDAIDDRILDNLVAWGWFHGYLTHFNPSDWVWTTNMFEVLRDGFDPVAQARTPAELADALDRLAKQVAPAALVWPADEERPPLPDMRRGARGAVNTVIGWLHEGYTPTSNQNGPLFSRRLLHNIDAHEAIRYGLAPDNAYETDLPGGVSVRVPHANYTDIFGRTLPDPPPRDRLRQDWPNTWDYTTAAERLAAVSFAWGLIQHFHPMIDREQLDWQNALREAMREALAARDRDSTTRVIQRLLARINDSRAEAWDPDAPIPGLPLFDAAVIDGALIVTGIDRALANTGIAPGDEILSIDGVRTSDALNEWRARTSAGTDEARDYRASLAALSGFPASAIELELRKPGGALRTVTTARARPAFVAINNGDEPIREVAPGIVYVDGARAGDAEVFVDAERVLAAPGVIFDLRSPFTELGMTTLGWIAPTEGRASDQFIHSPIHPDYNDVLIRPRDTRIMPNPFNAIGKIVFLVGPGTRGDAEFATLTMQDFNLGFVVGRNTAGAPGRPAQGVLPGGLAVSWSGLEARSVTGAEIFGYGVPPDEEAIPTRETVLAGEDPAINKAIDMLNEYFDTLQTPPARPNNAP